MVGVLVVGLGLAWRDERGARLAIPAALLIGHVAFSLSVAQGRWPYGPDFARASRYLYLGAAFTVPALGVAVDALRKRWSFLWPALIVLLLLPVPASIREFENSTVFNGRYFDEEQRILTTVVRMPFARQVPADVRPLHDVYASRTLTIGFLLDAKEAGRLGSVDEAAAHARRQRDEDPARRGTAEERRRSRGPVPRGGRRSSSTPRRATIYQLATPIRVEMIDDAGRPMPKPVTFIPVDGNELTIELPDLALRVSALPGQAGVALCERRP